MRGLSIAAALRVIAVAGLLAAPGANLAQTATPAPAATSGGMGNVGAQSVSADNAATIGPPAHPATKEQIHEYLALTGALQTIHTVTGQMVAAMRATSAPYLTPSFWNDLNAEFLKVDFESVIVSVYQQYVSEEDMQAAVAFYRSPAGSRLLSAQMPISRDTQAQLKKVGEQIGMRVFEKHKDEIEAAKKKYDAAGSAAPSQK